MRFLRSCNSSPVRRKPEKPRSKRTAKPTEPGGTAQPAIPRSTETGSGVNEEEAQHAAKLTQDAKNPQTASEYEGNVAPPLTPRNSCF
eukprot:2747715-Amphidinium_carterae.1